MASSLHTLEFMHNNRRHADRQHTPFKLMFGESPLAIPLWFERTKYPAIQDKMKSLIQNREEALAAHEVDRSRISEQRRSAFTPFKKGDKVWLDSKNLKIIYHKKMKPKREWPFTITKVLGTYYLQTTTPENMVNSQCFSCNTSTPTQGKQCTWGELCWISPRTCRRGRSLWSRNSS